MRARTPKGKNIGVYRHISNDKRDMVQSVEPIIGHRTIDLLLLYTNAPSMDAFVRNTGSDRRTNDRDSDSNTYKT